MRVLDDEYDSNGFDCSVTQEVVNDLDSLEVDLIMEDDIDAYIDFLRTPIDEYEIGLTKLQNYQSKINYDERAEKLKNIEPYSIYGGFQNSKNE